MGREGCGCISRTGPHQAQGTRNPDRHLKFSRGRKESAIFDENRCFTWDAVENLPLLNCPHPPDGQAAT